MAKSWSRRIPIHLWNALGESRAGPGGHEFGTGPFHEYLSRVPAARESDARSLQLRARVLEQALQVEVPIDSKLPKIVATLISKPLRYHLRPYAVARRSRSMLFRIEDNSNRPAKGVNHSISSRI
jgi:hypothetical protein